jgi:CRISPR/Cas system CSM-associated protein Csm3 (group 7 of RAMP superfamily)
MPRGEEFFNPYRILKQPDDGPDRRYRPDLSQLVGYLGRMDCRLEAHTPLEVNVRADKHFNVSPVIPGSSLKGVLRSFAELVGRGCMSISDRDRRDGKWALCRDDTCCITCDMFGRMVHGRGGKLNRGKVRFGEAVADQFERHPNLSLLQGRPKEKHTAFYPSSDTGCYRKLYHHHPTAAVGLNITDRASGKATPDTLFPVKPGSVFSFSVDFEALDVQELALLVYVLELEPGLLHKMGRGKGRGLGSVKIRITRINVQTAAERYRGDSPSEEWPDDVRQSLERLRQNERLDEVRRMLSWDAASKLKPIQYPTYQWFKKYPSRELRRVDEVILAYQSADDPPLPELATSSRRREDAKTVYDECPEGFDAALWKEIQGNERCCRLVVQISAIRSYKSASDPYVRAFHDSTDELERRTIVEAMRLVVPKKEYTDWVSEKLGAAYVLQEPSVAVQPAEESPSKLAWALLGELTEPKDVRKKVLKKYWKKLDESDRRTLAGMIRDWCVEHDCEDELKKMPDVRKALE